MTTTLQAEVAELYQCSNPGAALRAWAQRPCAEVTAPAPPGAGRTCACGASLNARNRSGRCKRCANAVYGRRYYAKKKGQAVPCAVTAPIAVTMPVPPRLPVAVLAECWALGERTLLTADQEQALARLVAAGGPDGAAAETIFLRANAGLVRKEALRHGDRGLEWDDLIQEGTTGLLTAIRRFDGARGTRFSTYATWWVRQYIVRACANQGRVIRLPAHLHEAQVRMARAAEAWTKEHGTDPTPVQLAGALGWPVARVDELRAAFARTDSLDRLVGPSLDEPLHVFVADPGIPDPSEGTERAALTAALTALLDEAHLTGQERAALTLRYGLGGGAARTLGSCGERLGVSRERVRQLEGNALHKLRCAAAAAPQRAALLELVA